MPTTPFTSEHEALRDVVRRLVDGPLAEVAQVAETGVTDIDAALQQCASLGLFELDDILAQTVVAQELGRLRSGGLVARLLAAMTTAPLGLDDTAVVREAHVSVDHTGTNGVLPFVVGGQTAQRCLLLERAVVLDLDGAIVEPAERAHAWRGAAAARITLDGAPTQPLDLPPSVAAHAELHEAAAAVGTSQRTFEEATTYAQQREAFGRPIGRFQVNRHGLADAATKITAAESLVHDVAWALSRGDAADTAAARLYAGRLANEVADHAVQLHGGSGYTTAFDASRAWRDAHALRAGDDERRRRLARKGALR